MTTLTSQASHGGIMFPLEMFRPSAMAQLIGEYFVAKARNVLDAQLVLTRHPTAQLILLRLEGAVVGDDEGVFWKENSDLVMLLSRALPLQTFLYYVIADPERVEGLIVAQGGQALMADEVTKDRLEPNAGPEAWPLARLCGQIGIDQEDLAQGLPGGSQISVPLLEPSMARDEELLRQLVTGVAADDGQDDPVPGTSLAQDGAPGAEKAPRPTSPKVALAEDEKRRAQERTAEAQEREAYAQAARQTLAFHRDDHGILVAPGLTLEDADLLSGYLTRRLQGDLPEGLPRDLTAEMQGKAVDILVPVEFLSEVFVGASPLSRPQFEASARPTQLDGLAVQILDVQAPRLGRGTLVVADRQRVFVSRSWDALPQAFVREQLLGRV